MAQAGGWQKRIEEGVRPYSPAAWGVVIGSVALASMVRFLVGSLSGEYSLPFAPFFPAVLISALMAGPVAGSVAATLSILSVWAVFFPPRLAVGMPAHTEIAAYALFAVSSAVVIALAESYRAMARARHAEQRSRELMVRELEHRGKNTFAVVQAIVLQSLEDQRDKAEEIAARIHAVSSTNDLITQSPGRVIELRALLEIKLRPLDPGRVALEGSTVMLPAESARGMSLVFHELMTNALKHGALSTKTGRVAITWQIENGQLRIVWREREGPAITAPSEYGFGARLVTRIIRQLGGTVEASFAPTGFACTITVPAQGQ